MDEALKGNILSLQREDTQTRGGFYGEVSQGLPVEQTPHWGPNGRGSKEKYFIFTERRYTNWPLFPWRSVVETSCGTSSSLATSRMRISRGIFYLYREKIHKLAVVSMEKCRRDFLWNKLLIGDLMDEDLKRNILYVQREDTQTGRCFHGEVSSRLPVEQAPHWRPHE